MFSNKVFQIAFLTSLIIHAVILFQNSNLSLFSRKIKEKNLEISYVKKLEKMTSDLKMRDSARREPFLKLSPQQKITADKRIPPPFVDREKIFKGNKSMPPRAPDFNKPAFTRPEIVAIKRKITLPPIDIEKINNPSYISYYQIVREKIKRAAYQNYTGKDTGEITVSFVISDDGYLKEMRLVEKKSTSGKYLRDLALRSVKDAAPFPNFPKELNYPRLSFNLTITFEIE